MGWAHHCPLLQGRVGFRQYRPRLPNRRSISILNGGVNTTGQKWEKLLYLLFIPFSFHQSTVHALPSSHFLQFRTFDTESLTIFLADDLDLASVFPPPPPSGQVTHLTRRGRGLAPHSSALRLSRPSLGPKVPPLGIRTLPAQVIVIFSVRSSFLTLSPRDFFG
jgi:hypothetical protein